MMKKIIILIDRDYGDSLKSESWENTIVHMICTVQQYYTNSSFGENGKILLLSISAVHITIIEVY